jgi:Holliday junction resolvase
MPALSRTKGAEGERELRRLLVEELGEGITRNLAQSRAGGHDLEGVPGWAVECKRARKATRALLRSWWEQTTSQAERAGLRPALCYREDRAPWLVAVHLSDLCPGLGPWPGLEWAAVLSLPAWCALVREGAPDRPGQATAGGA